MERSVCKIDLLPLGSVKCHHLCWFSYEALVLLATCRTKTHGISWGTVAHVPAAGDLQ
jgi:hypothetical protein